MDAVLALLGRRKALSDDDITALVRTYTRAYLDQVRFFTETPDDREFALRLDTTEGPVNQVLQVAKLRTRVALLDAITVDCPRGCSHEADAPECALDIAAADGRLAPTRLASFRRMLGSGQ